MNHLEFTGVGGVGKTSLYNRLLNYEYLYGGFDDEGFNRIVPGRVNVLPNIVNRGIEYVILPALRWMYYESFQRQYGPIETTGVYLVDKDEKRMKQLLYETMWKYEFGMHTKRNEELLLIDEGFIHRAASIAVRTNNFELPTQEEYFTRVPIPDILVVVTASNEEINRRKLQRGDERYNLKELAKINDMISELLGIVEDLGVDIIEICNEGSITKNVEMIKRDIDYSKLK